jgi:hypothetical protein
MCSPFAMKLRGGCVRGGCGHATSSGDVCTRTQCGQRVCELLLSLNPLCVCVCVCVLRVFNVYTLSFQCLFMSIRAALPLGGSDTRTTPQMTTSSSSSHRLSSTVSAVVTSQAGPSRRQVDRFPNQHLTDTVLSSDEGLAAYLLSSLCCHCENCGRTDTPQWRKGRWP